MRSKLVLCTCRLTALTSLCVQFNCKPQDLSPISQLRELRELRVEDYFFPYEDLAYLPLSLTSLDFVTMSRPFDEINAKVALDCSMGQLANLQQFRVHGYDINWEGLLAPLARISGPSDLGLSCYCRDTLCSVSGFGQLTRLNVSYDHACSVFGGLPFSDLNELKELRLVGATERQKRRLPAGLARLSSLSLLTSLTLKGLLAEAQDMSWLTCPTLLGGLQSLGVVHCSFPMLECMPRLSAATALRSLDLSRQRQMIGPHLSVITRSQHLTYLDVSQISGVESQHLRFLSELQSLVDLKMADNTTLDATVLSMLHPLRSLRSLDVNDSIWLGDGDLHHIAGIQGLSHLKLARCGSSISVAGILEMVGCGCWSLIRTMLDRPLSTMPGYDADVERKLRGPVGACSVYCDWAT